MSATPSVPAEHDHWTCSSARDDQSVTNARVMPFKPLYTVVSFAWTSSNVNVHARSRTMPHTRWIDVPPRVASTKATRFQHALCIACGPNWDPRAATCMATRQVQHPGNRRWPVINKSRDGYVSIEYDPSTLDAAAAGMMRSVSSTLAPTPAPQSDGGNLQLCQGAVTTFGPQKHASVDVCLYYRESHVFHMS